VTVTRYGVDADNIAPSTVAVSVSGG
jgi:hypothetical protein